MNGSGLNSLCAGSKYLVFISIWRLGRFVFSWMVVVTRVLPMAGKISSITTFESPSLMSSSAISSARVSYPCVFRPFPDPRIASCSRCGLIWWRSMRNV